MRKLAWQKLGETIQNVGYRNIIHKKFLMPNGQEREFNIKDNRQGSACTFAVTKDNRIVIARQYRPSSEKIMDELPGGGIDKGENPLAAAKRELLEETGYSGKFEKLAEIAFDAYVDGTRHYFLATDCEQIREPEHDEFEFIEIKTLDAKTVLYNATHARMTDPALALLALRKLGW